MLLESSSLRRGLTVAALMVNAALSASAQERRLAASDSVIPVSLFLAYVNQSNMPYMGSGGGETAVLVGRMPQALEARLPRPDGSRVLGTISSANLDFITFETEASADSAGAFIERELPKRGWRIANQGGGGGFRSAALTATFWCGESAMLRYGVERSSARLTRISYTLRQEDDGMCGPRGGQARNPFPVLYNPEDAQDVPTACRNVLGGPRALGAVTSAVIGSQMTPQQLIEHYGKQLADSGWNPPATSGEGAEATHTWEKRQRDGSITSTTITVSVPPGKPACRTLQMRVEGNSVR